MLFTLGMKSKEMDQKHQQGLKHWNAGNPNSYLFLLEVAIEKQSIEDAKFCLSKLAEHSEFFGTPSGPTSYYKELKERAEELIAKLEAACRESDND